MGVRRRLERERSREETLARRGRLCRLDRCLPTGCPIPVTLTPTATLINLTLTPINRILHLEAVLAPPTPPVAVSRLTLASVVSLELPTVLLLSRDSRRCLLLTYPTATLVSFRPERRFLRVTPVTLPSTPTVLLLRVTTPHNPVPTPTLPSVTPPLSLTPLNKQQQLFTAVLLPVSPMPNPIPAPTLPPPTREQRLLAGRTRLLIPPLPPLPSLSPLSPGTLTRIRTTTSTNRTPTLLSPVPALPSAATPPALPPSFRNIPLRTTLLPFPLLQTVE